MTAQSGFTRRALIGSATVTLAAPALLRHALGETPIRIGMPAALTGPFGEVGAQQRRGAEYWMHKVNANGGLLGREVKLYIQDTAGNPANCVRKAQEVVQRDNCHLLFGMTLSSEALAVVPNLAKWNAIFVSSDNGDGRLTGSSFVPNFFRPNTSGPMDTRTVSLYLRKSNMTKFYALGEDYAWGHNSVDVFKGLVKKAGKDYVGDVFSPIGTKDFSTYITKIRNSGAQACYLVLQGDDNNAFLQQAHEYRLNEKVQLLTSIVDLNSIKAVGEAALGLTGSTRYAFTIDNAKNKEFVADWQKTHNNALPDVFEGEQWQSCLILQKGIEAAKSIEPDKLRPALAKVAVNDVKGPVHMRPCDHQGVQRGFMVQVRKKEGYSHPIPEVIDIFPADEVTPGCRKMTYDS